MALSLPPALGPARAGDVAVGDRVAGSGAVDGRIVALGRGGGGLGAAGFDPQAEAAPRS